MPEPQQDESAPAGYMRSLGRKALSRMLESNISLALFAGMCAIADGVTTVLALESGHGYEMNTMAPTTLPGIMLHTFVKFAATQYIDEILPPKYANAMLKLACAIWGGVAVSNCFIIMHAPLISSILGAAGFILLLIYSFKSH